MVFLEDSLPYLLLRNNSDELVIIEGVDGNEIVKPGTNLFCVRQGFEQAAEFLPQVFHDSSKQRWL